MTPMSEFFYQRNRANLLKNLNIGGKKIQQIIKNVWSFDIVK